MKNPKRIRIPIWFLVAIELLTTFLWWLVLLIVLFGVLYFGAQVFR